MKLRSVFLISLAAWLISCSSTDSLKDGLDVALDEPDRKPIDVSRMGVNAFVNDPAFGSIRNQFLRLRDEYGLKRVRILFAWNDAVQPTPESDPDFSFYDEIAESLPSGVQALVVVTGLPEWMSNSANWFGGNPRRTFVDRWFKKVAQRYSGNGRILGWEVWNEPDLTANPDNLVLGLADSPANYLDLLVRAFDAAREINPGKLVLNAATTSIQQNFPETLNYNKDLFELGVEEFIDVFAIHYYGKSFERVVIDDGVANFLNDISKPIWITESGQQGVDEQLQYVEQVWPFLREKIPGIDLIFYYQFTENTPADSSYGLENKTAGQNLSNLAVFLRENS